MKRRRVILIVTGYLGFKKRHMGLGFDVFLGLLALRCTRKGYWLVGLPPGEVCVFSENAYPGDTLPEERHTTVNGPKALP